jgi:O-acetyl-ADP-ribose deacetylase (regulator of RNase III)
MLIVYAIMNKLQAQIQQAVLELVEGDITKQATDAIVNAANSSLLGGGGVDGAIHRAAGPQLLAETSQLGGCETGDAKISGGYRLKAKYVIHAVGPVYQPNNAHCADLLASAYRRSLEVAVENGVTTIAFPAISTGVYGYPLHEAAPLALGTVVEFICNHPQITLARFVLFDTRAFQAFAEALEQLIESHPEIIHSL